MGTMIWHFDSILA